MAYIKPVHQYGGDARGPFAPGGTGSGRVTITSNWGSDELSLDASQKIWKAAKACYVSNFAFISTDMDSGATLTWNVGSTIDGAQFIAAFSGQVAGSTVANVVDESQVAGTALAADAFIYLNVNAAATTPVAGTTTVSFDVSYLV